MAATTKIDLFGTVTRPARNKPRVLMHVVDAGDAGVDIGDNEGIALFECGKCGHKTDWTIFRTFSEAKRGVPCPACNKLGEPKL